MKHIGMESQRSWERRIKQRIKRNASSIISGVIRSEK
jgi:hypothetical protein